MHAIVDGIYRAESRRVFATLIRLLGDFDAAEEALHDAFRAALEQWPPDGVPANPRAWASRCPASDHEAIEIRQVHEMADFPADVQEAAAKFPELQAQQRRQARGLNPPEGATSCRK